MGEQSTTRLEGVAPASTVSPWFLRPDDWQRARRAHANMLLVGAPCSIADLLEALPDLRRPIVTWRSGERFSPPTANCAVGTMILSGVEALPPADQQRLYQWLQRRPGETQVLSTTARPLLPLVDQGAFHDGLYYRLNTVCVEVERLPSGGGAPNWLHAEPANGGGHGPLPDGWTLRIKPDRRQLRTDVTPGEERRGR
jgi:hypothetical protein